MTAETIIDQPNIIYTDAEVTVDSGGTPAESIWIRDGRIAAIGPTKEVLAGAVPAVVRGSVAGPEGSRQEIHYVQDWNSLSGKYVKVFRGSRLIREGRVEIVSQDSRMIWLESFGTDPRALFDIAEGYEIHLRLDALESDNSVSRPS